MLHHLRSAFPRASRSSSAAAASAHAGSVTGASPDAAIPHSFLSLPPPPPPPPLPVGVPFAPVAAFSHVTDVMVAEPAADAVPLTSSGVDVDVEGGELTVTVGGVDPPPPPVV